MKLILLKHPGVITSVTLLLLTLFAYLPTRKTNYLPPPNSYSKFISAYTGGEISKKTPVTIRFVDEMVKLADLQSHYRNTLITISPEVYGHCQWIDTRTIQFTPEYGFDNDKIYEASINLQKIISKIPDSLGQFRFKFKTRKRGMQVNISNPKPIDPDNPHWQRVDGTIKTSDYENFYRINNSFQAFQNGNSLKIKWNYQTDGTDFHFYIDSLLRKDKTSDVIISWEDNDGDTSLSGRQVIHLPPLDNFSHINTQISSYPEQYIMLEFTDPLNEQQDLNGLVRIHNADTRIRIENNKVYLYPKKRITGNIEVISEAGIENTKGKVTSKKTKTLLTFEEIYPQLKAIGHGTILPQSDILPFTFEAVNLSAVDIRIIKITEKNIPQFLQINNLDESGELKRVGTLLASKKISLNKNNRFDLKNWNKHTIDLSKLIKTEPGAIYQVALGFRKSYSLYTCSDTTEDAPDMLRMSETWSDPGYEYNYENDYWDLYHQYNEHYEDRDDPCKRTYYNFERAIVRNVLASNLGLVAKKGPDGSMLIAVSDILSTVPLSGTQVELYDYQQQLIASGKTENGFAHLYPHKKPFLLIAKHGVQRGYLKVDNGSSLSLSRFDISGKEYNKGIKGFIYGERDVWRPGDSIFLNFVLEDLRKALPPKHPVILELYNPQQDMVQRIVKTISTNNLYTFHTISDTETATGNYTAKVIVGGSTFEKTIKIETIIPNRLKIHLEWNKEAFHFQDSAIKGTLSARWLHGGIAKNMAADVTMTLTESPVQFKKYQAYTFTDPNRKFNTEKKEIFKGKLDESGKAEIHAKISATQAASGVLKANFKTKVFEPGGSFSSDYFTIPLYPYQTYVGINTPKGDRYNNSLFTHKDNSVNLVSLDASGNPVSGKKVIIQLYKTSWRWWWDSSYDEDFSYNGKMSSEPVRTDTVVTADGKAIWKLNINDSDWGRYYIKASVEGGHSTGQIIYLESQRWMDRTSPDNPEGTKMLTFSADKELYKVGDDITLNIPTSFSGNVLLSLESGTKVVKTYWVKAQKGMTQFKFPATSAMAPNVYAHITLIQPHAQTKNDLPIRMYGILPIRIENPATRLHPVITMPEKLKPEQEVSIHIHERDQKAMTYTVAIVDEGLLDLTRYKTPDIWTEFNQRQALDVRTWDMYDNVASADLIQFKNILSIGGDGNNGPLDGAKANRFKPVVIFLGPFHCNKGERKTHKVKLPNYIGSVKTMVIASYEGSYGNAEKITEISKPLMVLSTLPRILSPNEEINLPVSVFATEPTVKVVSLQVYINEKLTLSKTASSAVTFTVPGEQMVYFPVKVNKETGIATVKVIAKSGNESAIYETEIEVRSPNPMIEKVYEKNLQAGETWKIPISPLGIKGTNEAVIEVYSSSPLNLSSRLDYLIRYPYGCVEQTASGAFPQVYLNRFIDLSKDQKKDVEKNIIAAISKLKKFQLSDGSLSYWPGQHETNEWGTAYAGHFMIEAEAAGYTLPINFKDKWIKYIKHKVNNWSDDYEDDLPQAYRLYLLALCKSPELGAMNRMRVLKLSSYTTLAYLTAAYYLSGQQELAKEMAKTINLNKTLAGKYYSYGSQERDRAILLHAFSTIKDKIITDTLAKEISASLDSKRYMSTQTTAYCLIALSKYADRNGAHESMQFQYADKAGNKIINSKSLVWQNRFKVTEQFSVSIKNTGQEVISVRYISKGIPEEGDKTDISKNLQLDITYIDQEGKAIDPLKISQGTDFFAKITVENIGNRGRYENIALTQIFPSGWEIHNTRLNASEHKDNGNYTYQDIRDDRVNTFFNLNEKEKIQLTIPLTAAYEGRFYMPSIYAEAMYDNSISAVKHGDWVQVIKNNLIP
ncbi:MAG: hypothetical protein NVV82_05085 [Sporocytophaga sp.]|nr:hypothetical protein [Sporocytophaga sp.]